MSVQLYLMAVEAQKLAVARWAAVATGNATLGGELRIAITERVSAMHEAREVLFHALLGGKRDLGLGPILQIFRKRLRAGQRRLDPSATR